MIRLGFIGIQSKHAQFFGNIFNNEKLFKDIKVSAIWGGDALDKIPSISKELKIDKIVSTPSELINSVDAVLILLRNGNEHKKYAIEALNAKKPVFVDKPFTEKIEDAHFIINTAQRTSTLLLGGSTLKFLPEIYDIREKILNGDISHVSIHYNADPLSPYGGYYFYGSHLTELCTALCGRDFISTKTVKNGNNVCSIVEYPKLQALLHSSLQAKGLDISIYGSKAQHFSIDESDCYLIGMEKFVTMLKTGTIQSDYENLLSSVEMLQSIVKTI